MEGRSSPGSGTMSECLSLSNGVDRARPKQNSQKTMGKACKLSAPEPLGSFCTFCLCPSRTHCFVHGARGGSYGVFMLSARSTTEPPSPYRMVRFCFLFLLLPLVMAEAEAGFQGPGLAKESVSTLSHAPRPFKNTLLTGIDIYRCF